MPSLKAHRPTPALWTCGPVQAKSYGNVVSVRVRTEYPDKTHDVLLPEFGFFDRTCRRLAFCEHDLGGKRVGRPKPQR